MRRIAFFLYALCLILPAVGCKKEEPAATTTPPAATDSDADGTTDAADDAPADPAAK